MKCINKSYTFLLVSLFSLFILSGCGKKSYDIPYDVNSEISSYRFEVDSTNVLTPFARYICVADEDYNPKSADITQAEVGIIFNRTSSEVLFSKGANQRMYPASLTKVMTAYLALKYGKLEDILTASANVELKESGAKLCGFKEGDKATLEQVLYGLLVSSGNDAGVMIAEYISGSEEAFTKLMTEEAHMLGATNTNFVNAHGLSNEEHYTTAYDLYLIFNAALKYDKFKEIISTKSYKANFSTKDNGTRKKDWISTNMYLTGEVKEPSGVDVIGGKTGTTTAAGSCLIIYSINDSTGEEYISCILKSESSETLYQNMDTLLLLENQ